MQAVSFVHDLDRAKDFNTKFRSLGLDSSHLKQIQNNFFELPLAKSELCSNNEYTIRTDILRAPYQSCSLAKGLNVLFLHNHCPLFTR